MFSATVQPRMVFDSCKIMQTPCSCASAIVEGFQGFPLYSILPEVAFCIPRHDRRERRFPGTVFADQTADLPRRTSKSTPLSAFTGPNFLTMSLQTRIHFISHFLQASASLPFLKPLYYSFFRFAIAEFNAFDSYFFDIPRSFPAA